MSTIPTRRDYSLIGRDAETAVASGLALAEWYHTDIPRRTMKELMQRRDAPAVRDTIIWIALLLAFGAGGCVFWGTWWSVPFFACYGVLYGSAGDSRWHESGHGTAFRTRWMNSVLYYAASFMMLREPTIWRWSHARHHTDTIIVGRDPEINSMRPPAIMSILLNVFALKNTPLTLAKLVLHSSGRLSPEEATFVPDMERTKIYVAARIYLGVLLAVASLSIAAGTFLPMMLAGVVPTMYGAWLGVYVGFPQHAGLAENVLDHRLNSRTIYMNPILRFVYWNMNYHVEHHMFPMVPYHQLPRLHEIMKADTPAPYRSTFEAYAEILPALARQLREPEWFIRRELPPTARHYRPELHDQGGTTRAQLVRTA